MTKTQAYWAIGIGAGAAAVLLIVHLLVLPLDASWTVNRVLHHAWEVLAVLAGGGGVAWALWPRPKARKRNVERQRVRRRAVAVIAMALAAVTLVVAAEMMRDYRSRAYLDAADEDLAAVHEAAEKHRAAHGGEWPESLDALDLATEARYFPHRRGPASADLPDQGADAPPSYAVARLARADRGNRETRLLAYLKPGNAWAPLTKVVDKRGRITTVGEDAVEPFERTRKEAVEEAEAAAREAAPAEASGPGP